MILFANVQAMVVAQAIVYSAGVILSVFLVPVLLGMRYIPNDRVGIVERLWSLYGSVREGRLMAMAGETGYQTAVLRGGFHFFLWVWQYRIHKLLGEGQSKRVSMEGEAEANVLRQKVASYGDPRLYALSLVTEYLSHSQQPLVPQHLCVTGGDGESAGSLPAQGLLGTLLSLLIAEKADGSAARL